VTNRTYPRIGAPKRSPDKTKDGHPHRGFPCIVCKQKTAGSKWVQFSFLRSDDEIMNVCDYHWNVPNAQLLEMFLNYMDR